jgi:hypothetical protein
MYYFIGFILFIVIISLLIIIKFSKRRKLSVSAKKHLEKLFIKIKSSNSSKEKIIDFDKLYHKILLEL